MFESERERSTVRVLGFVEDCVCGNFFSEEVYYRRRLDLRRRYLRCYHFQICSHDPLHGFFCSSLPFEIIIVIVVPHGRFSTVRSSSFSLRLLLFVWMKINKLGFFYCSIFILDRELLNHRKTKEDEGEESQKNNGGERRRTKADFLFLIFLSSWLFVLSLSSISVCSSSSLFPIWVIQWPQLSFPFLCP